MYLLFIYSSYQEGAVNSKALKKSNAEGLANAINFIHSFVTHIFFAVSIKKCPMPLCKMLAAIYFNCNISPSSCLMISHIAIPTTLCLYLGRSLPLMTVMKMCFLFHTVRKSSRDCLSLKYYSQILSASSFSALSRNFMS